MKGLLLLLFILLACADEPRAFTARLLPRGPLKSVTVENWGIMLRYEGGASTHISVGLIVILWLALYSVSRLMSTSVFVVSAVVGCTCLAMAWLYGG